MSTRSSTPCPYTTLFRSLLWLPSASAQDPKADAAVAAGEYHSIDAMRRGEPLTSEPIAAPMARVENTDRRRQRAWPEQPPTIPHSIDGYQVDKHANRRLLCHARANAAIGRAHV